MSSTPALPEPADLARQRDEDAQYYRQVLHTFIAMAADLAEAVHRQALAEPAAEQPAPAPAPAADPTIAFDRLARTVRRTIALVRKLAEPAREALGPKSRPQECSPQACPNARRPDCAATDALPAEPWAEPCERAEGPDYDDDEDLDDDLNEEEMADFIASLRDDSPLAHLTDAQLRQLDTPASAQDGTPGKKCVPCARGAGPRTTQPRTTQPRTADPRPCPTPPPRPGTGPPDH